MPLVLSRSQVQAIDRRAIDECGMTGLVLMENAGRSCMDVLCSLGCIGPVVIVCGKGNNGGDGFVIARHLHCRDIPVKVLLLAPPHDLRGDAAANFEILQHCDVSIVAATNDWSAEQLDRELAGAEWIVDAVLGTGSSGAPRGLFATVIQRMNAAAGRKLAVDLPSGLDCDIGVAAADTFRADHTCTFVAEKIGFATTAARAYLGQVHIIDIGVPCKLVG